MSVCQCILFGHADILEQQDTLQSLLDMHKEFGGVQTEASKQRHYLCNSWHIYMDPVCTQTGMSMQVHTIHSILRMDTDVSCDKSEWTYIK